MPKVNSCNVKNNANPDCCPNAVNVGSGEIYRIKCKLKKKLVGSDDWFPFPEWCPLSIEERNSD